MLIKQELSAIFCSRSFHGEESQRSQRLVLPPQIICDVSVDFIRVWIRLPLEILKTYVEKNPRTYYILSLQSLRSFSCLAIKL